MNGLRPCRAAGPGEATGNGTLAEIAATMEVGGTGDIGTTLTAGRSGAMPERRALTAGERRVVPRSATLPPADSADTSTRARSRPPATSTWRSSRSATARPG